MAKSEAVRTNHFLPPVLQVIVLSASRDYVDAVIFLLFCFLGQTKFIPAFEKAFELLKGSVSENSGKSKKRVILFLTDGDPSDSKKDLFKIIRDRNLELNNSVIILTYGFDRAYQEILIDIANQNTSKYGVPANTSVGDIAVLYQMNCNIRFVHHCCSTILLLGLFSGPQYVFRKKAAQLYDFG